jgi:hypothetical protein
MNTLHTLNHRQLCLRLADYIHCLAEADPHGDCTPYAIPRNLLIQAISEIDAYLQAQEVDPPPTDHCWKHHRGLYHTEDNDWSPLTFRPDSGKFAGNIKRLAGGRSILCVGGRPCITFEADINAWLGGADIMWERINTISAIHLMWPEDQQVPEFQTFLHRTPEGRLEVALMFDVPPPGEDIGKLQGKRLRLDHVLQEITDEHVALKPGDTYWLKPSDPSDQEKE